MRMGIKSTKWKSQQTPLFLNDDTEQVQKKNDSKYFSVGQISPDLIFSIYTPLIDHIAEKQAEEYAANLLAYTDAVRAEQEANKPKPLSDENKIDTIDLDTDDESTLLDDSLSSIDEETPSIEATAFTSTIPKPKSIDSYLFASYETRDEFYTQVLTETSKHFSSTPLSSNKNSSSPQWKVHANAAKFERLLDEKYGRLRPFITAHPEIEVFLRTTRRKLSRGEYSPLRQGDPPLSPKVSIILLFLMHRNGVRSEVIFLSFLFLLVGLQPWALIGLVTIGRYFFERRKKQKIAGWVGDEILITKSYYHVVDDDQEEESERDRNYDEEAEKKRKNDILLTPVGTPLTEAIIPETEESKKQTTNPVVTNETSENSNDDDDETFDTLIIGSGPDTLFTAALLARTGRSVVVLSPDMDASGVQLMELKNHTTANKTSTDNDGETKPVVIPFDTSYSNIAHIASQQRLLVPALHSETDTQGGIRFARVGSQADAYTTDILSIPGMGVDNQDEYSPFLLRGGGVATLAEDSALYLADGWPTDDGEDAMSGSRSAAYLSTCATFNSDAKEFYTTKLLQPRMRSARAQTNYERVGLKPAQTFLDLGSPLNTHVRSLLAGMGLRGECLPPNKASMAVHVTNICALTNPEGFYYPIGGPRALCHALATVVEQNGGRIITNARIKQYLFESSDEEEVEQNENKQEENKDQRKSPKAPRCHGVLLADDRTFSVGTDDQSAVVAMNGLIQTFIFDFPDDIRTKYGIPGGLNQCSERRPIMQFLFALRGNSDDLNLTGADWYRLPNASLARDQIDRVTGETSYGTIGTKAMMDEIEEGVGDGDDSNSGESSENGPDGTFEVKGRDKKSKVISRKKAKRMKFTSGSSWMKISFPSAKDPSWRERYNGITTCVLSVEADDDFVKAFDTTPRIYSNLKYGVGESNRLLERVYKDLFSVYPQLEGKIMESKIIGPIKVGLSQTPQRFAAVGVRPTTPYPGLFIGGSDLTVSDSFSASMVGGWMAANAVLGYTTLDYSYLGKDITSDILRFMKGPKNFNREDIAVPYTDLICLNASNEEIEIRTDEEKLETS